MERQKKHYRRGRRKKKKWTVGRVISTLVLFMALGVFCFSGFKLFQIYSGYHKGESEYEEIVKLAVTNGDDKEQGHLIDVDFDALKEINPDVVAWIHFEAPEIINYPVVQGKDNDEYLYKTFKGYDNTVGTIFVNAYNNPDFNDKNTLIYGHYMYNGTMFNELDSYADKDFWEAHPYFYIYTPDGREIKYQIYSAGIVKDTSESYTYQFENDASFEMFLQITKSISNYDTGVNPTVDAEVVTLSTCTKDDNDDRFVVHGVKVEENGGN